MLLQVLFAVFYFSEFCENVSWSPCPTMRSTLKDFHIDNEGRIRANCVCNDKLFGDECQFKCKIVTNSLFQ